MLLAQRRWFLTAAWVLCVAGVLGATLVVKLADQACGWAVPAFGPDQLDLRNPSGHAASAAALWGGLLTLLAAGRGRRTVVTALLAGLSAALLIGVTRVLLGAHTVSEVLVGGAVGMAGVLLFGVLAASVVIRRWSMLPVAGALLAVGIAHGRHLAAEPTIHGTAVGLVRSLVPACMPPPNRS